MTLKAVFPRIARFAFCAVFTAASGILAIAQARQITLDDFAKVVGVSDPQISPDGKQIVCVVAHVNMEQDRSDRELLLVDVETGARRTITFERRGLMSPRWSPSGDRLAFLALAGKEKEEKVQVFVMPMNGGDPFRITDTPNNVEQFAWRPNGQDIAYVSADEPDNKKDIEHHLDAFEVGDNDYLMTAAPTSSHIWLVSAQGGKARRLTSGKWSLPRTGNWPAPPASPIQWSSNGKRLVFSKQISPHSGASLERTTQVLEVETGNVRQVTSHARFEGYGIFSPDDQNIAYWYPRDGDRAKVNDVYISPVFGGDGQNVTREIDRNISRAIWMPEGRSLLVGAHDGTRVSLWLQPLTGRAKKLDLGDVNPGWLYWVDVNVGGNGAIAFSGSTVTNPGELYYMASVTDKPRRLTDLNSSFARLALGKVERIEWQGPDRFREDGVLTYPPDFDPKTKYPLVLYLHGGPRSASIETFSFLPRYLASRGYVVFQPNYRGSDNLGSAFQGAINSDTGDGPGRDVISGIDAVKKMGFIDEGKIAVTGSSYGGYMTTWLIGHHQFWKAAIAGEPPTDWIAAYDLSDNIGAFRELLRGSPWVGDKQKEYRAQSPITYAANVKTPTLLIHDTGDSRVPIADSYAFYHALKDNGVEVKFIAYPVSGHTPPDPVRLLDTYRRWAEWLDKYLK
jgi:dipeptidyl aminopeptidase/acylaminoacyl peptidase